MQDNAAVLAQSEQYEMEGLNFHLQRGYYEELTSEEISCIQGRVTECEKIFGPDVCDLALIAAINRGPSVFAQTSLRIFALLTVSAFVAAGTLRLSLPGLAIVVMAIALHEFGHYLVMRLFHYSDARMFFVPGIGSGMKGQRYNVEGWKVAAAALAGPVPGILLGLALLWTARNALADCAAHVLLVLNGINLLPLNSFDGGRLVQTLFRKNSALIQTSFVALIGIASIAAGLRSDSVLWMLTGFAVLVSVKGTYRASHLLRKIHKSEILAESTDGETIPLETSYAIATEVKKWHPEPVSTFGLANEVVAVFRCLNTKNTGVAATILLVCIYLAACAGSFAGIAQLTGHPSKAKLIRPKHVQAEPTLVLDPSAMQSTTPNSSNADYGLPVVVATFSNLTQAQAEFRAAKEAAANDRIQLIGQTISLSHNGSLGGWPTKFRRDGGTVMIERPRSNTTAAVELFFRAPDEVTATNLETSLNDYFNGAWLRLWPPWVKLDGMEPAKVESIERIQHTWSRMSDVDRIVQSDPQLTNMPLKVDLVSVLFRRRNFQKQIHQRVQLTQQLTQREMTKLMASDDPKLDKDLITLYAHSSGKPSTNFQNWFDEIERRYGNGPNSLPFIGGLPNSPEAWQSAGSGSVERMGRELSLSYAHFYRTDAGLPLLVSYLQAKGCDNFRYRLIHPVIVDAEDGDQ